MLELVGRKIGMTHLFRDNGVLVPLTMVQVCDNCVISLTANEDKDFDDLLLAFERVVSPKKISKSVAGIFSKKSIPLFGKIYGSRVKKGLQFKVGDSIAIQSVLKEGDRIDVSGTTIGKGFAGAMKRWNFRGLEASHGVSVSHRSHGSTGQRQDPGKTFKGKKMAGHMGANKITIKNLEVVLIDKSKSVIGLMGAVPGNSSGHVILRITKNF